MVYLEWFRFPDAGQEWSFFMDKPELKRTCYDSYYPFQVLAGRLERLEFEPITILYGGNGSGKTTALNVMAAALGLERDSPYNQSSFFPDYVALCRYGSAQSRLPGASRAITSDDVFDYMLDLRTLNQGIDQTREERFQEYLDAKYADFQMRSLDDYQRLKQVNAARRKSQSQYVRSTLMDNVRERSNGESAFRYFTGQIRDGGLYLLDEPENSLPPARQLELARFLADSARFYRCQLVISTHSPFLLAMEGAKVYDLDRTPAQVRRWTELDNVRAYYDFFRAHEREFET